MALALAPYPIAGSVSTTSLSHHPSPAPSSSPTPTSPTSSTSSQCTRKRKRDEFLAASEPLTISSSPSTFSLGNVPQTSGMGAVGFLNSLWDALAALIGVDGPAPPAVEEVNEAPESPPKRVRGDSTPGEDGSTSDDQPTNVESIISTLSSQDLNKEAPRSPTNHRATLKIKAPAPTGRQSPTTQQLPSPLTSSSEDERESVFKKSTTTRPIRSLPPPPPTRMGAKQIGNDNELPFFAQPLKVKPDARRALNRTLVRRTAGSDGKRRRAMIAPNSPVHFNRRTPIPPSKMVASGWNFTPQRLASPNHIWDSLRTPNYPTSTMKARGARLSTQKNRIQKDRAKTPKRVENAERNNHLDLLLNRLITDKQQGFRSYEEVSRKRHQLDEDVRRMREAEAKEKIPPLTPEQKLLIKKTMAEVTTGHATNRVKTYNSKFRIELGTEDLWRVPSGRWLNDEVINFYLEMIVARSKAKNDARILAFNTFFFPKFEKGGHKAVARWASRQGYGGNHISKLDLILVPVHVGQNHWCLAVVNFRLKRFEYYDSTGGNFTYKTHPYPYVKLRQYVEAESGMSFADWDNYAMENPPQQANANDCGPFTLKTAEVISRGAKICFGPKDMPLIRERMIVELLNGELLPPSL